MIWNAEQNIQLRPAEGTSGESSICVPTSAGCFIGDKMKRIPLTQGQFAIVDNEDYEWLNRYKWYAHWNQNTRSFYAMRKSKKKENGKQHTIYMAREILGLSKGDERQSDHIDHITLNNCSSNLRIVTSQQNNFNRNPKGYSWHKSRGKYLAVIGLNRKKIHLGRFNTAKEAHDAYLRAKKVYHKIVKLKENSNESTL